MSAPRCRAITKAQWYGGGHPCKLPAWKDGLCRTDFHSTRSVSALHPGPCAGCSGLKKRNKYLREKLNNQRRELKKAKRLLERSAPPFDAACVAIRKALEL